MSLYHNVLRDTTQLVQAAYKNLHFQSYSWTIIGMKSLPYPLDIEENIFSNPQNKFTGAIRVYIKGKSGRIHVFSPKQPVYPRLKGIK